jgi:hypothetical protein
MPQVDESLLQAMHDYHFGNGVAAERVAVLVIDEQPFTPQQIAQTATRAPTLAPPNKPLPPTPSQIQWAMPIILAARRQLGGRPLAPTPPDVINLFTQVKEAFRSGPDKTPPTQAELQHGLEMVAQGKMLELCEEIVHRTDATQASEQEVLALTARLQIPVWFIELNPTLAGNLPPAPTRKSHVGLRSLVNGTRLSKGGLNAFKNTNLHQDLQTANIRRVVITGRQTNCCVKETAIGSDVAGATGNGYTVMTSLHVITSGIPTWMNTPGVEFYSRL